MQKNLKKQDERYLKTDVFDLIKQGKNYNVNKNIRINFSHLSVLLYDMRTFNLFTCLCFAFIGEIFLIAYSHLVQMSCDCDLQNAEKGTRETGKSSSNTTSEPLNSDMQHKQKVNFTSAKFFEPLIDKDFPVAATNIPRIPHIIHQTYKNNIIPRQLVGFVKTFAKLNPDWTYYFWTDISSRKFVAERFPTLLQMWDNYRSPINRADAIRYLILYEFGGFYADLDVQCMRPLDNVTFKYACIIPPEPFEQSVFRIKIPYLLNNAIMMCRPKHPFFQQIINSLHQYVPMLEQLDVAGPTFVKTQLFNELIKNSPSLSI
ncbi:uncharacterized protein LOC132748310 [Ruditapes philippinarum]|uniref:uncharacterized protein LOC132748310 n=1 Tax=Ruditapes philippinarum TaxID=129788 RepID=UPI00295A99B5|nr:uncharacterized protein LOC132748310 [Ruditapes philippinarum]